MKLTVDVKGLNEALAQIRGFSDRRGRAALATAMTRTVFDVRQEVQQEMRRVFDRPTPYTLRSVRVKAATAADLVAEVFISEQKAVRDPSPAVVLQPQVEGGARGVKGLELALRSMGFLPAGWFVVPGQGARLDSYGNAPRGLVQQVLAQLRRQAVAVGPRDARGIVKAIRKAGSRIVVFKPGGKVHPGVYSADVVGRNLTPIFVFVQRVTYRKRLDFHGIGRRVALAKFEAHLTKAFADSAARLRAR